MTELTDEQLVVKYLSGDKPALDILIKRYLSQIYGFAFGYVKNEALAEDVAQETFVKAWKKLKQFNPDKKFKAWLYAIARNTALDQLRKKQPATFSEINASAGENYLQNTIADSAMRPDEMFELSESDNWFKATVAKLSLKYRQVVIMRHNDYFYREIAEQIGEPLHTVKSRYRRALIQLKKTL